MLTRDQILGADDLAREEVQVEQWGGSVFVRALTGREILRFEQAITDDEVNIAELVALVTVDESGDRLFTDENVEELGEKNAQALLTIFNAALRVNGLTAEVVEEAKKD